MGTDCVFVAENLNGVTIEDIEADSVVGNFPGGSGKFKRPARFSFYFALIVSGSAYSYIEFINDLVIVHDGCRKHLYSEYQNDMLEYLKRKCGGKAGVWGDSCHPGDSTLYLDTSQKITNVWPNWPQPECDDGS